MDINRSYSLINIFSEYLQPYGFAIEDDSESFSYDGLQTHEGRRMEVVRAKGVLVRGTRQLVYELTFREDQASVPLSSVEVLIVRDDSSKPFNSIRRFSGNSQSYEAILKRILDEDVREKLSDILSH